MAVYKVWRVDCEHCGEVIDYGEDECSVPEECESCGEPVKETDGPINPDAKGER